MKTALVTLDPIDALSVTAEGGLAGARAAFHRLESAFPTLRGRRFYGALEPDGTYRACAAGREGDDPAAMELEEWEIPGGRFARATMPDWTSRVDEIGPSFARMVEMHEVDPDRPSIEFYRSQSELILLLPVR